MKKIMSVLGMLALVLVLLPKLPVQASEVTTYTEVKFIANVPEGFAGDVIVIWENTATLKKDGIRMNAEDGYTYTRNILGGEVYNLTTSFVADGEWKTDIPAQYEIPNGEGIEIVFNVLDGSPAVNILTEVAPKETEVPVTNNSESAGDGDIDPLTGILKGEVAIQNFIDKVSFIQDESAYEGYDFLLVFSVKDDYLGSNPLNTSEKWDSMTAFEQYVWRKAFFIPNLYLYKHAGEIGAGYSIDDFIKNALLEKSLFDLKDYPREDEVYDAVVELCEWHYNYFLITGTVYDYYNGNVEYVDPTVEQEASEKAAEVVEDKELEAARDELLNALTEEEKEELGIEVESEETEEADGMVDLLKDNILTIVLLVIIGVLLLIVLQKKRK